MTPWVSIKLPFTLFLYNSFGIYKYVMLNQLGIEETNIGEVSQLKLIIGLP